MCVYCLFILSIVRSKTCNAYLCVTFVGKANNVIYIYASCYYVSSFTCLSSDFPSTPCTLRKRIPHLTSEVYVRIQRRNFRTRIACALTQSRVTRIICNTQSDAIFTENEYFIYA